MAKSDRKTPTDPTEIKTEKPPRKKAVKPITVTVDDLKASTAVAELAPPEREVVEPPPNRPRNGSFIGRLASGRGRTITADDSSFSIEANPPLNARELAIAVKHGFDDESPTQDASLLIADKKTMRGADGDINHVARVVTGNGTGRDR
jgi:hypothetical protein